MSEIERLMDAVESARLGLLRHPIYEALRTPADILVFLEHHVFCVWDFQSLLKALQARLTCTTVPWLPSTDREARRFINEVVLDEESDADGSGSYLSHFELYLDAMSDAGADKSRVNGFLARVRAGESVGGALRGAGVGGATAAFVEHTFDLIREGALHKLMAAFALGREDLIPGMFIQLVEHLREAEGERFARLLFYLRRHISVDGDQHGPRAKRVLDRLCEGDPSLRCEALRTAACCLHHRMEVWNQIRAATDAGARLRRQGRRESDRYNDASLAHEDCRSGQRARDDVSRVAHS